MPGLSLMISLTVVPNLRARLPRVSPDLMMYSKVFGGHLGAAGLGMHIDWPMNSLFGKIPGLARKRSISLTL